MFLFFFGLTLFRLFKEVHKAWATVILISIMMTVGIAVVNTLNHFAVLLVLSPADYLKAFTPEQLNAMAMNFLRLANSFGQGLLVLINGAAGGVGTFAVQVAKSFSAEVTAVCSTRNLEMVRSIGAHRVIDYTREDFTKGTQRYDLIFDLVANHSFSARRRVVNPKGIYIGAGIVGLGGSMIGLLARRIVELVLSRFVSQKFVTFMAKLNQEDLAIMGELMEARKVTPVIDRCYTLSEVPEAIRYLEQGHARGKVVITLECNNKT